MEWILGYRKTRIQGYRNTRIQEYRDTGKEKDTGIQVYNI